LRHYVAFGDIQVKKAQAELAIRQFTARVDDALHGVGSGEIAGSRCGAGSPVRLAIDFKQGAASLFSLVLILAEALGQPLLSP
jgi:hypothetical protein